MRVVSVPFGEAATRALADMVTDLRGGDPLAPLAVTVPSAAAGTTLRRRLASGSTGLVNVTFQSLPQLAARLAAPALAVAGQASVPPVVLRGHLRAALRTIAGPLAAAASSAATERALEASLAELAELDEGGLRALARRGGITASVVAVASAVRATAGHHADPTAALRAAIDAVADGSAPLADVGPVVVHLPRRLKPLERALLDALAARHPLAVLVGRTGDEAVDRPGASLLDDLAARLSADVEVLGTAAVATPTTLVRAPDPAEEAAAAVRIAVAALERGVLPERIALLSRVRDPYAALLHEQLAAAGVPHHAPSVGTLAQSVAGRVLLGALDLRAGDYRRAEVVAWWRAGPVHDVATGKLARVARWDRIAREAGVVGGLDQWHQRLAEAMAHRRQYLDALEPSGDPSEEPDRRLADIAALDAAIAALADHLEPPSQGSPWSVWSRWAGGLLDGVLGPEARSASWPEEEQRSRANVAAAVDSLARLDGVDAPPDLPAFRHALERELDRPAKPHGRFGHGVTVGSLLDAVGADLDVVVVVGAAEGQLPPRRRDDPLVPDRDRRAVGLAPRSLSREEEARDLLAALAAAPERVLVAPRSDPRAQRERQPAPAFLDACGRRTGDLVASGQLRDLRHQPWFADVESFEWWPSGNRSEQVSADVDLGILLADHRAERPLLDSAPVVADPALGRGLSAALARRDGAFDAWSGNVGSRPDLLEGFDQPRSPTGLENYAACPFRFFLRNVLGVGALDDPTELERMSGRDVGVLVHAVLERFIDERGIQAAKQPDEPWSVDDRRRLLEIAEEEAAAFRAEGRTGRPLLWEVQWHNLRRQLIAILDADEAQRRDDGMVPVAVEHRFGVDDSEPVTLDLGDGRTVAFRGIIDRVDRSVDGRKLRVVDYKTGGDEGYDVDDDLTARGQKLQLAIYALAARRDHPGAEEVEARYWFVNGGRTPLRGGRFDAAAEARFTDVVTTVLDGVVAGRFPANPGDEKWSRGRYVHQHCKWCDYDRVCATTRGWAWQQARQLPELADYVALAEAAIEPPAAEEANP